MGRSKKQGPSGAGAPAAHVRALLTFALSILEGVARLTGESLVAAEGTYGVHAVLAPAARVQVRHTLVDVCRESAAIRYWGGGGSGRGWRGEGCQDLGAHTASPTLKASRSLPPREPHAVAVHLSMQPFIQQRFIKHLLCPRAWFSALGTSDGEQDRSLLGAPADK